MMFDRIGKTDWSEAQKLAASIQRILRTSSDSCLFVECNWMSLTSVFSPSCDFAHCWAPSPTCREMEGKDLKLAASNEIKHANPSETTSKPMAGVNQSCIPGSFLNMFVQVISNDHWLVNAEASINQLSPPTVITNQPINCSWYILIIVAY